MSKYEFQDVIPIEIEQEEPEMENDSENDTFLEESAIKKAQQEKQTQILMYSLIASVFIIIFITLLVIGSLIGTYFHLRNYQPPVPSYVDFGTLQNSVEFQITLSPQEGNGFHGILK